MIAPDRELVADLLAEVRHAPSVHNIQASRWRIEGRRVALLGDPARAIPVADPKGRDWRLSHGIALEAMDIALARRGLAMADIELAGTMTAPERCHSLLPVASFMLASELRTGMSLATIQGRSTWRGSFKDGPSGDTIASLTALRAERDDLILVAERDAIDKIAQLADLSAMHFLREEDHRRELLAWMRLATSHPDYERDGLNSRAMCLNSVEAWSAGLVLGRAFKTLDRLGLAGPILSERNKTCSASAIALFHRPEGEDALQSGRQFYSAWLAMESRGLKCCPMSVLADWPVSRHTLERAHGVPGGRAIVSVFRIGEPDGVPSRLRARLPVAELVTP